MEKNNVLSEEMAEEEFGRWLESVGVDEEDIDEDSSDGTVYKSAKKAVVKALIKGSAVIDDAGSLFYTVSRNNPEGIAGKEIKIRLPTARVYSFGSKNQGQGEMVISIISGMTGEDKGWIEKLSIIDFKLLAAVASVFLL